MVGRRNKRRKRNAEYGNNDDEDDDDEDGERILSLLSGNWQRKDTFFLHAPNEKTIVSD
jgi:hypothetical protein